MEKLARCEKKPTTTQPTGEITKLQYKIASLEKKLADIQVPAPVAQYVSVAGCANLYGEVSQNFSSIAYGSTKLEAEVNARLKVKSEYQCTYGIGTLKTEVAEVSSAPKYCVAGCTTILGDIALDWSVGANGKNRTEAEFLAFKKLKETYSCSYGSALYKCE